jgi:hypothetical protein
MMVTKLAASVIVAVEAPATQMLLPLPEIVKVFAPLLM